MKHTEYKCNCNRTGCMFCDGGLFSCTVCNGFEGTLTTECCGHKLHPTVLHAVYTGKIDYVNGKWIKK